MDSVEEIVDFLEKKQNVLEEGEALQNINACQNYSVMQTASNNIVTKKRDIREEHQFFTVIYSLI